MANLESLITEANSRGLRVNNLCQLPPDFNLWQANITDGELFWEFGRGSSASAALEAALYKQSTTKPEYGRKATPLPSAPSLATLEL